MLDLLLDVSSIVVTIVNTIVRGVTFKILWMWFVVTTFGLAPLSIPACLGLSAIIGLCSIRNLTPQELEELIYEKRKLTSTQVTLINNAGGIVVSLLVLLNAWIIHLFM